MPKKKKVAARKTIKAVPAPKKIEIRQICFNSDNGSVLGLGADTNVYVWNVLEGIWMPVRASEEQLRSLALASKAAKDPANEAAAPAAAPAALG